MDKPLLPCPIPEKLFAKNNPGYEETYSLGEDIPGCEANEIYTSDNFVDMVALQKTAFAMRPKELAIPIFTWEKPIGGKRLFTICSRRAMCKLIKQTKERFFFWQITQFDACAFYLDFDLSYSDMDEESRKTKCVNGAIAEILECIDIAIVNQRAVVKNPSFANVRGYTISRLDGNKPGKESTHLNIHFNDFHMFKDYQQAQWFCALVLKISNERYPDRKDNPNYIYDAGNDIYKSILDFGCFLSVNRNWRCIACYKNKQDPSLIGGPLFPPCASKNDKLVCDDINCRQHVRHLFTEAEFCENDPTFIPRGKDGYPIAVPLLTMEEMDMPERKTISGHKHKNDNNNNARVTDFFFDANSNSSPSVNMPSPGRSRSNQFTDGDGSNFYMERRRIADLICRMITRTSGEESTFARFISAEFFRVSSDDNRRCVYRHLAKHRNATRKEVMANIDEHKSNHIQYLASINLPAPIIHIHCTDPLECGPLLKELTSKENQLKYDFEIQKLDVNTPQNADLMEAYTQAVKEYMLKFSFVDNTLTATAK